MTTRLGWKSCTTKSCCRWGCARRALCARPEAGRQGCMNQQHNGTTGQLCTDSRRWTRRRWSGRSASAGGARPQPHSATGARTYPPCTYLTRWELTASMLRIGCSVSGQSCKQGGAAASAAVCLTTLCVAAGTRRARSRRRRQRLQRPPLRWLRSAGRPRARCCSSSSGRRRGPPPGGRTRARMCGTDRASCESVVSNHPYAYRTA